MSSLLSAELSATCNALGTYDKKSGKYLIDDFTLNTVKDLIRYLRRDGEEHEIRRHFGQTKVLQTDLLPMLIDHWENTELFDVTLRLLVNLTNPALLLYREEVPVERTARHNYLQILSHLQFYKEESFTKVEVWTVFAKKLAKILEVDWSERDDDTGLIIERILILIRNVLHVPADLLRERRPDNDASVHDQVLWALNQSGTLDIILYMSSEKEKQYTMHVLEIVSHLLREQNPSVLAGAGAGAGAGRGAEEKLRDLRGLREAREGEARRRAERLQRYSATRHSRFGGTYVVRNLKSISEQEMICLKPASSVAALEFSGNKKEKYERPRNRRPPPAALYERRSPFAVRLFLKEFCIEFLNNSYNVVMRHAREVLSRATAQAHDDSYFLWAMRYFMQFNRGHRFRVALVSETLSVQMFHYVQQQMEKYSDMMKMEKKQSAAAVWSRRLHLALRAYKELIGTLRAMGECDSARVLQSNLFYVLEYREFVINILLHYDDTKMPCSYLEEVVETVHLYLKMLEHFCRSTGLVVQKKIRKKKSKKRKSGQTAPPAPPATPGDPPAWEEVRAQLAAVLSAYPSPLPLPLPDDCPPPFDAASDVPVDDQREDCLKRIQKCMREHKYEEAVGTLRAAREVWPTADVVEGVEGAEGGEGGVFGSSGDSPEEELALLETVYRARLHHAEPTEETNVTQEDSDDEEDEEEEQAKSSEIVESDFDFKDFVSRLCDSRAVRACCSVMERYSVPGSERPVRCATKLLHRVAVQCARPALLYQASLFRVFQRVLRDGDRDRDPRLQELCKFATYVLRQFAARAADEPKLFVELLFWKNCRDAAAVQHGYQLYGDGRDEPARGVWTEEQEDELRSLYLENQAEPRTDKDVIDWILENLVDRTRTRRGVLRKLRELGLVFAAPTKRSNKRRERDDTYTSREDELLAALWERHRTDADPMAGISAGMPRKRSRASFVDRLLQLGLVQDRKECRKKRRKTSNDDGEHPGTDSDDSDDDKSSSSSGDESRPPPAASSSSTPAVVVSSGQLSELLRQAVDADLSEALRWVAESLSEAAEEAEEGVEGVEEDEDEGEDVPLVPLSAAAVEAMQRAQFRRLLAALRLAPPDHHQEIYWRIPRSLDRDTLRSRRDLILSALATPTDATDATPTNATDSRKQTDTEPPSARSSDDEDNDVFDRLRKLRENNADGSSDRGKKSINRKRSRSVDAEDVNNKEKMQKIDEDDEPADDNDDVLSFARKTLQHAASPPSTPAHPSHPAHPAHPEHRSEEAVPATSARARRRRRPLLDDDSD